MRLPFVNRHPRDDLSAYADGQLAPARVPTLEAHLATCDACRAELEAIRAVKSQLASLPEIAPRSFALTPEMARRPAVAEAARLRPPSRVAAFSNGMRLAGAGMSLALVIVLVLNFSGGGSSGGDNSASLSGVSANQPEANAFSTSAADAAVPKSDAGEPVPSLADNTVSTPPDKTEDNQAASGVGSLPVPGADASPVTPDSLSVGGSPDVFVPAQTPVPSGFARDVPATAQGTSDVRNGAAGQLTPVSPHAAGAAASQATDSGSSVDTMLIIAIALAAGVVLAFAGSWLLPRLARDRS